LRHEAPLKSGHKKPGLNDRFGRDRKFVPGLFSEFFNVAASRPAQMTTERAKPSGLGGFRQATAANGQIRLHGSHRAEASFLFAFRRYPA
jgi:hypothetical protein